MIVIFVLRTSQTQKTIYEQQGGELGAQVFVSSTELGMDCSIRDVSYA